MDIVYVGKDNFEEEVLNSEVPVLLDFYADWCGSCRNLAPVLAEVAAERDDVKIGKVNVDAEKKLVKTFGVKSIPTLVLMEKGDTLSYTIGAKSKKQIMDLLDKKECVKKREGFFQRLLRIIRK